MKLKKELILLSIFIFIFLGCAKEEDESSNYRSNDTSSDNSTTETDTTPPYIVSTSPSNGESSIPISKSIEIFFSEIIDNSSITVNELDNACFGSIQLSKDGFTNCIKIEDLLITTENRTKNITALFK